MENKPFVIGIAGGSGSGKTFFLKSFLNHFDAEQVCLLSQDDYYIPVGEMTAEENKLHNFDLPECMDNAQFEQDIAMLLKGQTVYKQQYNFNNHLLDPQVLEIKPAPLLIVEGLFIYHLPNINKLFDYRIFINADIEVALARRISRDFMERGYSEQDVRYKWNNHVLPSYQQYLLPYRDTCDQVLENSTNEPQHIVAATRKIAAELKSNPVIQF